MFSIFSCQHWCNFYRNLLPRMAKCKDFSQKIQIPECHCFPQGKSTMFFSLFSELAGECTYACTCSNLRLNFWLLTANNYLQYTAAFILGKKYCKQWMYGSGGQGSIAWYIVVLCLSSRWALTLVMYVLLGNYGCRMLPVTQEVSAHAGWLLAPLLCSTAKPAQVTMLAIPFPF